MAGSLNGIGSYATFNNPQGIAVDSLNNVYVADSGNGLIRKITSGGIVSTLAFGVSSGTGAYSLFNNPSGIAVGPNGVLYVSDTGNHRIVKIVL